MSNTAKIEQLNIKISELDFSDLYLEPNGTVWSKRSPDDRERLIFNGSALVEAQELRLKLQEHKTGMDFTSVWDGIRLRIQRVETVDGDVFVCRKLLQNVPSIHKIGYTQKLIDALLSERLNKGGVVLFTGGTGTGKSTSLGAWLSARLNLYGGAAWTIENPIEMLINNANSAGICYQTEVRNEHEIGVAIQKILRTAPNIIMVGEVRTNEAAKEIFLGGTSGHLLGTTFHANDIISCLDRMKSLLSSSKVDIGFMAESLAAIIHQTFVTRIIDGKYRKVLSVSPLIISGSKNVTSIRSHLRSGEYSQLVSEIERQKVVMNSTDPGVSF